MRTVNPFEAQLLRILQGIMGEASMVRVIPLIVRPSKRPACLSADAIALIKQAIATGTTLHLARAGGWRQERFLRRDQLTDGRLWDRTDPQSLGLSFTRASLDVLVWITASGASKELPLWVPEKSQELTIGDHYLLYRIAKCLESSELDSQWYAGAAYQSNPLIAITMPDQFAENEASPNCDFESLFDEPACYVLEAMQHELATSWLRMERAKSNISRHQHMHRLGQIQHRILGQFFDVAEKRRRRDLCGFVLTLYRRILKSNSQAQDWTGSLDMTELRIADRNGLYRDVLALLHWSNRLRSWQSEFQSTGYFDEGYAESQWWKSRWESDAIDQCIVHADRILHDVSF